MDWKMIEIEGWTPPAIYYALDALNHFKFTTAIKPWDLHLLLHFCKCLL